MEVSKLYVWKFREPLVELRGYKLTVARLPEKQHSQIPTKFFLKISHSSKKSRWPQYLNIIVIKIDFISFVGSWQQPNLKHTMDAPPSQVNFSTVAVVPISDDVPLTAFTYELYHSLCAISKLLLPLKLIDLNHVELCVLLLLLLSSLLLFS
jgi:hypothetical protein